MSRMNRFGGGSRRALVCASLALAPGLSLAQEGATSPPPPLEFPSEANPQTERGLSVQFFRAAVEQGADFGLCKALMTKDGKPMPRDGAGAEFCPPEYSAKVAANQGFIQWASNARPLKCGECVGRPFMSAETKTTQPNLRRAMLYGRLVFLSTTGPNRTITYPFDAYFTCKAPNGAREGDLAVDIKFGQPVIGDPGFWESVASFFTAGALSDFIDGKIRENIQRLPSIGSTQGRCLSVGVDRADDARFDMVRFDLPRSGGPAIGQLSAGAAGALQETATVRLLSVRRLPLPPNIAPEHAHPGDPAAAQFSLYVNGAVAVLPAAGLALPPEGGSAPLNLCKTVDLGGRQRLQILIANDLGGAAWSEFARSATFGAGGVRKLTTGRTIVVPGTPGPPDPITGKPSLAKPQPVQLREFELTYDVAYGAPPSLVAAEPAPGRRPTGVSPAVRDAIRAPRGAVTAADPGAPAPQPCRPL